MSDMFEEKSEDQNDVPYRRRGRPTGKNRVPLSLEERRARNALYERERRNETAEAMVQLAEAVGCDPNIANADLLATVISQIQRSTMNNPNDDIDELTRINQNLESQIAMLQERLGLDDESFNQLDSEEFQNVKPHSSSESTASSYCNRKERPTKKQTKKRKSRSSTEQDSQEKRAKTKSETSTDSGVEMQRQSVSPTETCSTNNTQYWNPEQLQVPVEIIEENVASQTYVDLQSELYNQIYNSEGQTSVQSIPDGASVSDPCMERLSRSLIVVPSIISPQEPPDLYFDQQTQSEPTYLQNIEPPCNPNVLNTEGECEIMPRVETTLDFLTDTERGLINYWLDGEFQENSTINDQTPMTSYSILSEGYL